MIHVNLTVIKQKIIVNAQAIKPQGKREKEEGMENYSNSQNTINKLAISNKCNWAKFSNPKV